MVFLFIMLKMGLGDGGAAAPAATPQLPLTGAGQ